MKWDREETLRTVLSAPFVRAHAGEASQHTPHCTLSPYLTCGNNRSPLARRQIDSWEICTRTGEGHAIPKRGYAPRHDTVVCLAHPARSSGLSVVRAISLPSRIANGHLKHRNGDSPIVIPQRPRYCVATTLHRYPFCLHYPRGCASRGI